MRTPWTPTAVWLGAASAAFLLAAAAPNETSVMGRLPTLPAKRLDQQVVVVPHELPAKRSLVLIAYDRTHRDQVDSWIRGMKLEHDASIPWVRMPVLRDPGTPHGRDAIEQKLLARHTTPADRARLVPVFTDRQAFVRAAGLSGPQNASVLVLDREGQVLARAEGFYNARKADALRETLFTDD